MSSPLAAPAITMSQDVFSRIEQVTSQVTSTVAGAVADSISHITGATKEPELKLYFLQASRSIRTAWLLEALNLPYDVEFSDRVDNKAPPEFKKASGNPLGKFPTLWDGDLLMYESGSIAEYICETYDPVGRMLPKSQPERWRTQLWIQSAEGTFLLHALAITYARWNLPEGLSDEQKDAMEKGMSVNVQNDLQWLDDELSKENTGWLVGKHCTAADIMVHFSVQFIFARQLGVRGCDDKWKAVRAWQERCENESAYKKAVERTNYTLFPKTM